MHELTNKTQKLQSRNLLYLALERSCKRLRVEGKVFYEGLIFKLKKKTDSANKLALPCIGEILQEVVQLVQVLADGRARHWLRLWSGCSNWKQI